jgi:hypothetical protein
MNSIVLGYKIKDDKQKKLFQMNDLIIRNSKVDVLADQ